MKLTQALLGFEIEHPHPSVAAAASNELSLAAVKGDAGQVIVGLDALDQPCRLPCVEEVGRFTGCHAQDSAT